MTRAARLLWDKGIRDVRTLTRESLSPAVRPSLPQHLLFLEENLGNPQDRTFGRTDGGRSGIQEMKVWAPGLKQLRDRDSKILQNILDLTDWRGLHMTATPGPGQRSTEWAIEGRSQGSVFKVASTVSIHSTPSWSQLEAIKRFLANSLLLELKIIQISTEEGTAGGGTQCRITFTIQVRNRHRATETARELGEWLKSSLEGILVEEGLWKAGTGSPAPDTPRVFEVLGGPRKVSPALGEGDTAMRTQTVAEFLSAHFQAKWKEEAGGGLLPPPCIHPPRDLVKGGKGKWRSGLKDLIRWIYGDDFTCMGAF